MTSRSHARRLLTSFTASIGITVAMLAVSPVVLAQASDRGAAGSKPVTMQAQAAPATNLTAAALIVGGNPFGCYGRSDRPHISSHYPDRVTAQGTTYCTAWQPYEYVDSYLYRKDCVWFVCWWTQVGHDSSSSQSWGAVYAHPSYTCNGTSSHTYLIQSYHEVHGTDGKTYTGYTANQYDVPCG